MKLYMKILLITTTLQFGVVKTLPAQIPPFINYQGFLTDVFTGNPSDTTVTMNFTIYDAETGGSSLWTESQTVSVKNGYFSVLLGKTNAISPVLFFMAAQRYLGVQVGDNDEMTPRKLMTSSAYSLVSGLANLSEDAAKLNGKEASEYITNTTTQTSSQPGFVLDK